MLAQVQLFQSWDLGPSGPDLGPGPELEKKKMIRNRRFLGLECTNFRQTQNMPSYFMESGKVIRIFHGQTLIVDKHENQVLNSQESNPNWSERWGQLILF